MMLAMEFTIHAPPLWAILMVVLAMLFFIGALPIPVGYNRGKIAWVMWCGTGMHAHIVYWHTPSDGYGDSASFQTLHPADASNGGERE